MRPPPSFTLTDTLLSYTTLFRSWPPAFQRPLPTWEGLPFGDDPMIVGSTGAPIKQPIMVMLWLSVPALPRSQARSIGIPSLPSVPYNRGLLQIGRAHV